MRAWIGFTLAFAMATTLEARAADWYTGVPTDGPEKPTRPTVAIDMAIDGTSQSALSGALIATIAPFAPLDESGFRFRASGLGGKYSYTSTTVGQVNGTLAEGSALLGYEWVSKKVDVAVYGGADIMDTSISPNDPNNTVKGMHAGFKIGADMYATPTDTTMVSGVLYYSTNHNAYYGRLKFGMAFADHVYVGPEVLALGDSFFQQFRVGAHVSGFKLGDVQFGVSGGYLHDKVRGSGAYGILESRVTF